MLRFRNIKWLRRFFRRKMSPVPVDRAHLWRNRLSLMYMFVAWNAFGAVCYMMYTGKTDWAKYYGYKKPEDELLTPGEQWAKTLKVQNAKIIRISGLQKTDKNEILYGEVSNEEFQKPRT